jgi:hypothetical protein
MKLVDLTIITCIIKCFIVKASPLQVESEFDAHQIDIDLCFPTLPPRRLVTVVNLGGSSHKEEDY